MSDEEELKRYRSVAIYIAVGILALTVVALMCVYAGKALVAAHNAAVASTQVISTDVSQKPSEPVTGGIKNFPLPGFDNDDEDGKPIDIRIPRCDSIHLSLAEKICDFSFTNPETNKCYLRVSITRHDTNETVFTSSLISPGKTLENITLSTSFSHFASYEAMVKVDAYSLEGLSFLNSLVMDAVIYTY